MDLGFFRRAEQLLAGRSAAGLDFGLLLAMLRAHQSVSAAARAEALCAAREAHRPQESLIALLLGETAWREAVPARLGCFNPAVAYRGNAPSTEMTRKFTFAF